MTDPTTPPPAKGRLRGTLRGEKLEDRGYAWVSLGKGEASYFILRNQLPPEAWVRGALIEFTPEPPRPGTDRPRAGKPLLLRLPNSESAA